MTSKFLPAAFAALLFTQAQAQPYQWSAQYGGVGDDVVRAMTADAAGNVYTVGYFTDSADFDPGTGTHQLVSNGFFDIFIQKLDPNGDLVWAHGFGGTFFDYATGVDVDANGNVYVTGVYQETVDFDHGTGVSELTSSGAEEIFVLKLDANGDFVWARSMGSPAYEESTGVAVDGSGNVYVTGYFDTPGDYDPGAATFTLTSNGGQDMFLVKLDQAGDFLWAHNIGGTEQDLAMSIAATLSGEAVVTGFINNMVDLDPGTGTASHDAGASSDGIILRFAPDGTFNNFAAFGGAGTVMSWAVDVDDQGNAYAAGGFTESMTAGSETFNSAGIEDAFVVKADPQGQILWAKAVHGIDYQNAYDVSALATGEVVIAGFFAGTTDADPSANELFFDVASGEPFDAFYLLLGNDGGFLSAGQFGGSNFLEHHGAASDGAGNFYLAAAFQGTVDLDPDADDVVPATAIDFRDNYVIKMGAISTAVPQLDRNSDPLVWPVPATDRLHIAIDGVTNVPYTIHDHTGRQVDQGVIGPVNNSIDVQHLPNGAYVLGIEGYGALNWVKQ